MSMRRSRGQRPGGQAPEVEERLLNMELAISRVLQLGVTAAAVVIAFGLILLTIHGHSGYPHQGYPRTLGGVAAGLASGKPYAWIAVGLLLLILTPMLRVAVSVGAFLLEQDSLYVAITLFVLGMLIFSFILGSAGW